MDYFKEALIAARETAKHTNKVVYAWPYEAFIISMAHLVNKVIKENFKIENLDEVLKEAKILRESTEKHYSDRGIKYE